MLSLFCGFPSGPQWKQCCLALNTPMLPDAATESQKQEVGALLILVPPPSLFCMVTKHAERESKSRQPGLCSCFWRLTSAPDKLSLPCPQQFLQGYTGLSVYKLCDWCIDICMCTQPKYVHCSHSAAKVNTQRNNPSAQDKVKSYKNEKAVVVWPRYTSWIAPWRKEGSLTFKALISLKRPMIVWFHTLLAREAACAATWHCEMSYRLKSRAKLCGLLKAQ